MQYLKTIAVCLVLIAAIPELDAQPRSATPSKAIPDRVSPVIPGRQAPEWVSAHLILQDGQLQRDLFAPTEQPLVEMHLETGRTARRRYLEAPLDERPTDPCVYVASSDRKLPPADDTIPGLAQSSTGIFLGTVVAERPGLLRGIPRTLLRVKVDRTLKHELPGPQPDSLLVAYPEVKMEIDGICLAAKSPRHPERPEAGRQILLFTGSKVPLGAKPVILHPSDEEVFFQLEDGRASLPAHFGELLTPTGEPLALDFVVEQTEEALAAVEEGAA